MIFELSKETFFEKLEIGSNENEAKHIVYDLNDTSKYSEILNQLMGIIDDPFAKQKQTIYSILIESPIESKVFFTSMNCLNDSLNVILGMYLNEIKSKKNIEDNKFLTFGEKDIREIKFPKYNGENIVIGDFNISKLDLIVEILPKNRISAVYFPILNKLDGILTYEELVDLDNTLYKQGKRVIYDQSRFKNYCSSLKNKTSDEIQFIMFKLAEIGLFEESIIVSCSKDRKTLHKIKNTVKHPLRLTESINKISMEFIVEEINKSGFLYCYECEEEDREFEKEPIEENFIFEYQYKII